MPGPGLGERCLGDEAPRIGHFSATLSSLSDDAARYRVGAGADAVSMAAPGGAVRVRDMG
jgi:hypothetical protein